MGQAGSFLSSQNLAVELYCEPVQFNPYHYTVLVLDLYKCHPPICVYVSQVVSFLQVMRQKFWTHFSVFKIHKCVFNVL
jgi:hypothetical protein